MHIRRRERARLVRAGRSCHLALRRTLSRGVLLKHPQVEPCRWSAAGDRSHRFGHEPGADSMALQVVPHMKVVEVGAPGRVSVEDGVSKAHDGTVQISDDGIPVRRRPGEPARPLGHPVSDDVTIKKRIQERAPIVAPPAFSMQLSDGFGIVRCRLPILHTPIFPDPASPAAIRGPGKRARTPRTRSLRPRSGAWVSGRELPGHVFGATGTKACELTCLHLNRLAGKDER